MSQDPLQGSSSSSPRGGRYLVVGRGAVVAVAALTAITAGVLTFLAWPIWKFPQKTIQVVERSPSVDPDVLQRRRAEVEGLQKEEARLRKDIKDKRANCANCLQAEEPPTPPQQAERPQLDCDTVCRLRPENRQQLTGNVSVSLAWENLADLDLHLICPGGSKIYYGATTACSGKLNQDVNKNKNGTRQPLENITLTENSPEGQYVVRVVFYNGHDQFTSAKYRVTVNIAGQSQTFEKTISVPLPNRRSSQDVHTFRIPVEGQQSRPPAASFRVTDEQRRQCNCAARAEQ